MMLSPINTLRMTVVASVLLTLSGLAAFWYASNVVRQQASPLPTNHTVLIRLHGTRCEPDEITVPAGRTTFKLLNQSNRTLEWEILDGVMIVDERENIPPGASQTLIVKLLPGEFAITCGLLNTAHAKLTVTPAANSEAEATHPPLLNYLGALAEYRVYLSEALNQLVQESETLLLAIEAGNMRLAKNAYRLAHQSYLRIEPMAEMFSDLHKRIHVNSEHLELREADPAFMGFHHLEYGLFAPDKATTLKADARQFRTDVISLRARLQNMQLHPQRLAPSAARLLKRMAGALTSDTNIQQKDASLTNLRSIYDGTKKIATLLAPLLADVATMVHQDIELGFAEFDRLLTHEHRDDTVALAPLDNKARQQLSDVLNRLSDSMFLINMKLGLE